MVAFHYPKDIVPGEYAVAPDAVPGSHDEKSPPLAALYPERDRYLMVSPERYYSKDCMDAEWEGLWGRVWTCAGRVSDIPSIGSWFHYELGRESFIVVRSAEDRVEAFYNVCPHRGNRIARGDCGVDDHFTCSFHGWQWKPNGQIQLITDVTTFKPEVLKGRLNLKPVRCEIWAGFVFVNMDEDAEPLHDFLAELPQSMASYGMESMHVIKEVVIELDANWKIVLEAFLESYHLQETHPQALPFVDDVFYQLDFFRNGHGRLHTGVGYPSPRCDDRETLPAGLAYMLAEAGIDPATYEGRALDVRAALLAAKRRPDNAYGLDYSGFTDSQVTDDWNYSVFPNMTFNTHPEGVLVMRFLPHPTDPEKSLYHVWVISRKLKEGVRPPAYMGVEPDVDISGATRPACRHNSKTNTELGEVLDQDVSNVEAVQQGLRSRAFAGNLYSEQEQRILQFHAEVDRRLAAASKPAQG